MRLFLLTFLAPVVATAAPMTFHQQTRLLDASGGPLTGAHTVEVRLFDAQSAGNQVFTETFSPTLEGGYFSVTMGAGGTPLDSAVLTTLGGGWAEFVVDGNVLTPRQETSGVPYARQEEILQRLDRLTSLLVPATCPAGMARIAHGDEMTFCIDQSRRGGVQYEDAAYACAMEGKHVCTSTEWYVAARTTLASSGAEGITNMCSGAWAWEWTSTRDQANGGGYLHVTRGGNSANCQTKTWEWTGQHNNYSANIAYRCCQGVTSSLAQ